MEAGSSAEQPIPPETVKTVRSVLDVPLIVGGGIRTGKTAESLVEAGADIIVTGTVLEEAESLEGKVGELVEATRRGAQRRRRH